MLRNTILAIFLAFFVSSCGGGSNSGSILPQSSQSPVSTGITVDATSLAFSATKNATKPNAQTVTISWTDSRIVDVVIDFQSGTELPDWLDVSKTSMSNPITYEFTPTSTKMNIATYTTSFNFIAKDNTNNDLTSKAMDVSYEIKASGINNRGTSTTIKHYGQDIILNGANVAWSADPGWYNADIGSHHGTSGPVTNLSAFQTHFRNIANAGGNSARIWLHTAATITPNIQADGSVTGLSNQITDAQVVQQLNDILDAAWTEGLLVTFSLFSFDMMCDAYDPVRAKQMLETHFQSYIDNALTPMVTGVKDHPAMFAWEIFNEPEGMSQTDFFCPSSNTVSTETVQSAVNQVASAVHQLDPNVKVTTSTHTDLFDRFSNATLQSIPNALSDGTLDFYELHWYDSGWQVSPHITTADEFMADAPIIIGEYDVHGTGATGPSAPDAQRGLLENGYHGAWAWSLTTGDVAAITGSIAQAASLGTTIDKVAIEACLRDKPSNCYTD